MPFVIVKSSRFYAGGPGYTGPACDKAGVIPGMIYVSEADAAADARRLSEVNPVGFVVAPYQTKGSVS